MVLAAMSFGFGFRLRGMNDITSPDSSRTTIRLHMSMSLDGFIAGPDDQPGQELGRDGGRLFNWLDDRHGDGPSGQVYGEVLATGAVISGRRTFELAGRWNGDHHDGVPIFVLTNHVDPDDVPPGSAQFVTDVTECAELARTAAGDRVVMVHGAGAAQSLLRAGQLDEIDIHLVSVLLGEGRRLFDALGSQHIELERVRVVEARDVTHLRYRVRHD
ncbi:bifunctional deaminase-reductase domain protein [Stackebrandtia nassauensis DSM 44728]|uniref:Bifunctional deaminase-reductase domain protein n=2 Tax=Stackebrandtia TaxID=283810 RepID=D3PWJ4_STANL|nr:bifunctional deaminase-reductase domain protein [Stackebrandtia nassauensis DSM 44728]